MSDLANALTPEHLARLRASAEHPELDHLLVENRHVEYEAAISEIVRAVYQPDLYRLLESMSIDADALRAQPVPREPSPLQRADALIAAAGALRWILVGAVLGGLLYLLTGVLQ